MQRHYLYRSYRLLRSFVKARERMGNKKGFSLIELLVIVAIVGVFAVFALITLNPLEQVRKSRDTGKVSKAKKAISAAESYFVFYNKDPGADGGGNRCPRLIEVQALKPGSCDGIKLIGTSGTYQVTFTAESKGYQDQCGGTTCSFPGDF